MVLQSVQLRAQAPSIFSIDSKDSSIDNLKMQILQLGASLDRGQGTINKCFIYNIKSYLSNARLSSFTFLIFFKIVYNPTSGEQYKENMDTARLKIETLVQRGDKKSLTFSKLNGEW